MRWFSSKSVARRVRHIARRIVDPVPITGLGILAALVFWAGLEFFATQRMDVVMLVACSAGLGLLGIAVVSVAFFGLVFRFRARHPGPVSELRFETDRLAPTGWVLKTLDWLPLVAVRWEWERPEAFRVEPRRRLFRREERVVTEHRGRYHGVRRRVVVEDVFRLARIAFRVDDPVVLEVRPHPGRLARMEPLTAFAGGDDAPHPMGIDDGDRTELRRYVPGDPARFIHWKAFARTRKLVVRVPERALSQARRTAAFLVAGESDEASAAAARVAVERGALGRDWVFGAAGAKTDAESIDGALELIVTSADHRDGAGAGLSDFVERAERAGPAALVVFAPPTAGPWIDAVHELAARRARGLRVVIAVDGLIPAGGRGALARLLTVPRRPAGLPVEVLDETLRALGRGRVDVVVYDRRTGRRLGGAHVKRAKGPTPRVEAAA